MNRFYTIKRKNGLIHCEDGPAVITSDGTRMWYQIGVKHRLDGPAVEWADGTKEWWVAGWMHRRKGFAIEYPDGTGIRIRTEEAAEFEKICNLVDLEAWIKKNRTRYK